METDELFAEYKGIKIALYGLGTETEKVLENLENGYDIIGLLDGFREDGELYGRPIISLDDAIRNGVGLIIVVARPGSCRAITKRIRNRCLEHDVSLMDVRGKDLLVETKTAYDFSGICGVTKEELREEVRKMDAVSFDLFDTLVMRQVLASEDIIRHVERKLWERGIFLKNFCKNRLASEKELSRNAAPALTEIYKDVIEKSGRAVDNGISAEFLSVLEWQTDFSFIIPRRAVCEICQEAIKTGKKVYIVSDTYYGKAQLAQILDRCGITGYADILSSSEYGTGKTQALYEILRCREPGKRIIHIGDDILADIENARKHGLETCRLMSAAELLEAAGNLGFTDFMGSLAERLKIGMFAANIFNSPFQFEQDDKYIGISDAYDIGYLICAPMISDFVLWFYGQMRKWNFPNIWFSARDGYLIKKMYAHLAKSYSRRDESVYFQTSRIAAIRAGVKNKDDVRYLDGMKFSGTLEENLKARFGIDADDVESQDIENDEMGLSRYKKSIINGAKAEYKNYEAYIGSLDIKDGDVAFFDFVAKGTIQMYIQRLVPNHLKGFYFMQIQDESMKDRELDVCSFYKNERWKTCTIFDDYYILETVLTAPHPSVTGFDGNGKPIYALETRRCRDIHCFERIQEGIMDYFISYTELCPEKERNLNKKLDEVFLGLVHKVRITDGDFLSLVVEDPFFNRMTKITDVL